MSAAFPNGWSLKRAKDELVGAMVHTGAIRMGEVDAVRWNESQIVNVTADAFVVGMLTMNTEIRVVNRERTTSFLIADGRRRGFDGDRYTVSIHPAEVGFLHRILGFPVSSEEQAAIAALYARAAQLGTT